MEKEQKGLFGRLLDFWKEKIGTGETKGIGFWNGATHMENLFAQMNDTISVKQKETKKAFRKEQMETVLKEKEQESGILEWERKLFSEEAEDGRGKKAEIGEDGTGKKAEIGEGGKTAEKGQASKFFAAEIFQKKKRAEAEKSKMGQAFLWGTPAEESERRSIVPVTEPTRQEKRAIAEEEREMPKTETAKKEEPQTEIPFDIEKLMQQMTKKLWEERESCGRRLRR